ncbi:hypothetical protein DN523_12145 [Burkholderia multivorans]|nr:hypothetical protein C6V05_28185 [Burkholderia multivorans]RAA19698.1 hypothetical protein DN470_30330 [Burkholderia multivorans]RAA25659.1 hypothetical protein DN471_16345 [Burkholderia multivorans]RAA37540.1 hypothetical protein DN465_05795 [Burkholderia multivorans]RAA42547.1 hypothetical protein DN530_28730 [Burkholderia multivorans]
MCRVKLTDRTRACAECAIATPASCTVARWRCGTECVRRVIRPKQASVPHRDHRDPDRTGGGVSRSRIVGFDGELTE